MHFGGGGGGFSGGGAGGGHSGGNGAFSHSSGGHDSSVIHHHDGGHHDHAAGNKDTKHHAAASGGNNASSSGASGLLAQIGHLLGLGGHSTIHHHHSGGEPDQSPSWNMAWQAVPDPWFRLHKIRFRFTPALGMMGLFAGLIMWLGVIYNVRHHEPAEFASAPLSQAGNQQPPRLSAANPIIPSTFTAPTAFAAPVAAPTSSSYQPQPASAAFGSPEQSMPMQYQPSIMPTQQQFGSPGAGYAAQPTNATTSMVAATPKMSFGAGALIPSALRSRPSSALSNAYPAQRLRMFVQR